MSNTAVFLSVFWGVMLTIIVEINIKSRRLTYDGMPYGWRNAWKDFSVMNDWGALTYLFVVGMVGFTIHWLRG